MCLCHNLTIHPPSSLSFSDHFTWEHAGGRSSNEGARSIDSSDALAHHKTHVFHEERLDDWMKNGSTQEANPTDNVHSIGHFLWSATEGTDHKHTSSNQHHTALISGCNVDVGIYPLTITTQHMLTHVLHGSSVDTQTFTIKRGKLCTRKPSRLNSNFKEKMFWLLYNWSLQPVQSGPMDTSQT